MLIDWFTVVAQTINFLILVWLMKRYLYQPILNAIDAREAKITAALKDAESKQTAATQQRNEFQKKNDTFEQGRSALLQAAQDDAKTERKKMLDQTRKDVDVLRTKLEATLQGEHDALKREVTIGVQEEVFSIARRVLSDLGSASVETQIIKVFIDRLRTLDEHAKTELTKALKNSTEPALVRSAFALSEGQQKAIQLALKETFAMEAPVKFDIAPRLVCGVELSINGQKLAWSIDDYLTSLDKRINDIVTPAVKAETNVDAKTGAETEAKTEDAPTIIPMTEAQIQANETADPTEPFKDEPDTVTTDSASK
ncbi:F0F1 ATP synthase subunit delta [Solimicrobium silvestre]|uniref:ATP synthase subunit b n=1 Tax=Solimicrobium silvestre TaxID=2099400 RepID=A0A2S9GW21_9BURK|nr:F0F1 ATP synthase subunit delta [Solimicrobium silvestre]PRC91925.1 Alternate F1F0 ATPase, F0 subunit B [Solimicrobium silvestre]